MSTRSNSKYMLFQSENIAKVQPIAEYLRYKVIDSDNQEEQASTRQWQTHTIIKSVRQTPHKSSFTSNGRSSSSNFMSNQNFHPDQSNASVYLDKDIRKAENQVLKLKKECELLERMIADMANQQARIVVALHVKERKKSLMKFETNKSCPIHNKNIAVVQACYVQQIPTKESLEPSILTPVFSKNIQPTNKAMDEMKTIQISKIKKPNTNQQNITPVKKIKQSNKQKKTVKCQRRQSICLTKTKKCH